MSAAMKILMAILWTALAVGCDVDEEGDEDAGADEIGQSGLELARDLASFTEGDFDLLCDWAFGLPENNRSQTCGNQTASFGYASVENCKVVNTYDDACAATVADAESCIQGQMTDPCTDAMTLEGCTAYIDCITP